MLVQVEKVVKDPEAEAEHAKLQKAHEELQKKMALLEQQHQAATAEAEKAAKVKADMIEYSWSCCICTEYLVKSRLLACGE